MKTLTITGARMAYGVTDAELDRFAKQMNKELDADRKAGRLKLFTGKLKRGSIKKLASAAGFPQNPNK
jgi:hypothetical protein